MQSLKKMKIKISQIKARQVKKKFPFADGQNYRQRDN